MQSNWQARIWLSGVISVIGCGVALAEGSPPDPAGLPKVLTDKLLPELAGLLAVATAMETALTTLFNWRLYREFFNGRAVKTLVMILFGGTIVSVFNYDVIARIIVYSGGKEAVPATAQFLTASGFLSAMVLAGGSAAVFELFKRLGLRSPVQPEAEKPLPPQDRAWLSVRINPLNIAGPAEVFIEKVENPTDAEKATPPLSGVLSEKGIGERLYNVFMTDPLRFPPSGGYSVEAGQVYRITARAARMVQEDQGRKKVVQTDTVFVGRFAGRSIIDLVHKI